MRSSARVAPAAAWRWSRRRFRPQASSAEACTAFPLRRPQAPGGPNRCRSQVDRQYRAVLTLGGEPAVRPCHRRRVSFDAGHHLG